MPAQVLAESRWGGLQQFQLTAAGLVSIQFRAITVSEPYGRLWMVRRLIQLSRPLAAGENINVVYISNEGVGTASARYEQTDAMVAGQQSVGPAALIAGPNPYVAASSLLVDIETRNSAILSAISGTVQCWCAPMIPVTPLPGGPHG